MSKKRAKPRALHPFGPIISHGIQSSVNRLELFVPLFELVIYLSLFVGLAVKLVPALDVTLLFALLFKACGCTMDEVVS